MWIFVFRVGNQQQEMGGGEGINTHPEKLAVGLLSSKNSEEFYEDSKHSNSEHSRKSSGYSEHSAEKAL